MKLRYYVVDRRGTLQRARHGRIQELWDGKCRSDALGVANDHELRLVTAVCDDDLTPQKLYLLRLPLTGGKFTEEDYLTLRIFTMPDCVTPREVIDHHGRGWPADLYRQLAVALDVPVASLKVPVRIGGPLMLAAALRVPPRKTRRYL